MAYTPPSGDIVAFDFTGAYTSQTGDAVILDHGGTSNTLPVRTGLSSGIRIPWNDAPPKPIHRSSSWRDSVLLPCHLRVVFDDSVKKELHTRSPWGTIPKINDHTGIPWGDLLDINASIGSGWDGLTAYDDSSQIVWDFFVITDSHIGAPYIVPPALDRSSFYGWDDSWSYVDNHVFSWWNELHSVDEHLMTQWGDQVHQEICYQNYVPPAGTVIAFNLETPLQQAPTDFNFTRFSYDLRCATRQPGGWRDAYPSFPIPGATSNPILRTYIVLNTISVLKLPERVAVAVSDVSLSLDIDSWAWKFTAKVLGQSSIDLIKPSVSGAVEIEVTINGYIWVFVVEQYSLDKSMSISSGTATPQISHTVSGRSKTAYLADPYKIPISYEEAAVRTAQQLAEAEVTGDGWTVNWNTVVWTVPAGAYYYTDKTPIQAVRMIADSVGAVILPDRSADQITINPRYRDSSWGWGTATPSASLTLDVVKRLASRWNPKPDIDGVYVSGEAQGVSCFIRRQGTAGANLATEVVDRLITHQDAGRERGRNIISDRGNQEVFDIELPLMPSGTQLTGTVTAHNADGTSTLSMTGGGTLRTIGQSVAVNSKAFVRGNEIIGDAPNLTSYTLDV
jgi:hypothetical protein